MSDHVSEEIPRKSPRLRRVRAIGALALLGASLTFGAQPAAATNFITSKDIVVIDAHAFGGNGGVIDFNTTNATQTNISSGNYFRRPFGAAFDATGHLLVVDSEAFTNHLGGVISIDTRTGDQTPVTSEGSFINPTGIAVEADGNILVVDADGVNGAGAVVRVNPVTNVQTVLSSGGFFGNPEGIALEANGNILVADPDLLNGKGGVVRIDRVTGQQTVVSSAGNFGNPSGVAVEASGNILVVDPDARNGAGGVIRVNPFSGVQTVLSSGGSFGNPTGIAIEAAGTILVADPDAFGGNGGVFRIDQNTGARSVVTSGTNYRDPVGVLVGRFQEPPADRPPGYEQVTYGPPLPGNAFCISYPYQVPAGTTKIRFEVSGEPGFGGQNGPENFGVASGGSGGFGALATGVLTVTPGQLLYLNVGFNNTGGPGVGGGGVGGDFSSISLDPASTQYIASGRRCNSNQYLAMAGGGGGGGAAERSRGGTGGDAGLNGADGRSGQCDSGQSVLTLGACYPGRGGGGATQTAGGAGGPNSDAGVGQDGSPGRGQAGGRANTLGIPLGDITDVIVGAVITVATTGVPVSYVLVAANRAYTLANRADQLYGYIAGVAGNGIGGGGGGGGGHFGGGGGGEGILGGGGGGGGGSSYLDPVSVGGGVVSVGRTRNTTPYVILTPLNGNGVF